MHLHSHPVEAAGGLVDDTEAGGAVGAPGLGGAAQTAVVANSILELVHLGDLGLQLTLEILQLKLLGPELLIPTGQLLFQLGDPQPEEQYQFHH